MDSPEKYFEVKHELIFPCGWQSSKRRGSERRQRVLTLAPQEVGKEDWRGKLPYGFDSNMLQIPSREKGTDLRWLTMH